MAKRKRSSWKVHLTAEKLAEVAAKVIAEYPLKPAPDHRLCSSSGVWRTKSGSLTVRLVYKGPDSTFTLLIRNLYAELRA